MPATVARPFLDLCAQRFAGVSRRPEIGELQKSLQSLRGEPEFDLLLWSFARSLTLDTEELLRQLGEQWLWNREAEGVFPALARSSSMEGLRFVLEQETTLRAAPIPGMAAFVVVVLSARSDGLKIGCEGARRCCSFVEGAARAIGHLRGESIRYLRQPKNRSRVDIHFSAFAR